MPDVHMQHVIFTRVEKRYSPNGLSGYQIIYQSPSLGAECAQIEKRIQCFLTNKQQINRYQFFWTIQGQAVFTKSVSLLSPDPEVIDRNQRDAFLVHALVMNREDFAMVRNDPFAVFEAAETMHLLTENVEQIVTYSTETPPPEKMTIPIRKQTAYLPDGWSKEEIQNLYRLGEVAPSLNEQKKSLLMITADSLEMFKLLGCLLILLPPNERAFCTFDTFVDSCTPAAGSFWAIGGTKAISNSSFVPMRMSEHKAVLFKHSGEKSAYSIWFSEALYHAESFEHLNADLYSAQVVAEAFNAKKALPDEPLNEGVLRTFSQMNQQTIDASLYKTLAASVDKHIAEAVVPLLYVHLTLHDVLSIAAQETCNLRMIAQIVYLWFLNEQPEWKRWEDVLKFAERVEDAPLLLLASLKARPLPFMSYEKQRQRAIQALLVTDRLPQVLSDLSGSQQQVSSRMQLSDEEFQMVVSALLQQNVGHLLQGMCTQRVAFLQNLKIVQGMLKAVNANKNVASEFVQALQSHPFFQVEK